MRAFAVAATVALGAFSSVFFQANDARAADASAPADQDVEAFARVVVDSADLRTGPGVSFRVIYTAHRGETLALDSRPGSGYWLKVTLPDGRSAYALGDEVEPFAVRDDDKNAPSRPGFFAPPPLAGAHGGLAIIGGVFSGPTANGSRESMGYLEARPSIVIDKTLSLDGFIGDALTSSGSQIIYGGGATVYLFPTWALCPFVGIGGGGISIFPNSDSFVLKREDLFLARAGGGLLFALRSRILVRLEVTNMTLFNAETYRNAQTYAGGFGVYF
ncbi:MAG TPA: SH3 domain-containing protein [Polyangiaceae bacterium]